MPPKAAFYWSGSFSKHNWKHSSSNFDFPDYCMEYCTSKHKSKQSFNGKLLFTISWF